MLWYCAREAIARLFPRGQREVVIPAAARAKLAEIAERLMRPAACKMRPCVRFEALRDELEKEGYTRPISTLSCAELFRDRPSSSASDCDRRHAVRPSPAATFLRLQSPRLVAIGARSQSCCRFGRGPGLVIAHWRRLNRTCHSRRCHYSSPNDVVVNLATGQVVRACSSHEYWSTAAARCCITR